MSLERLEYLKDQIRKERNTHTKSELIYEVLEVFIALQTDESWKDLINLRNGRLDGTKIALELCASRNVWRKPKFAQKLNELNEALLEKKIAFDKDAQAVVGRSIVSDEGVVNPIQELNEAKLKARLKRAQDELALANLRIQELEKRLVKYEKLSELEKALTGLRRVRA